MILPGGNTFVQLQKTEGDRDIPVRPPTPSGVETLAFRGISCGAPFGERAFRLGVYRLHFFVQGSPKDAQAAIRALARADMVVRFLDGDQYEIQSLMRSRDDRDISRRGRITRFVMLAALDAVRLVRSPSIMCGTADLRVGGCLIRWEHDPPRGLYLKSLPLPHVGGVVTPLELNHPLHEDAFHRRITRLHLPPPEPAEDSPVLLLPFPPAAPHLRRTP